MDESTARTFSDLEAELAQAHRRIAELEALLHRRTTECRSFDDSPTDKGQVEGGWKHSAEERDRSARLITAQRDLATLANGDSDLPEERYRGLINGMNDTICVIDDDARILDINNTAIVVLGYSREELLSMYITDIDASLSPDKIHQLIATMPMDKVQLFETRHRTKDGRIIPVEISSSLISYAGKTVIMSIARDITERMRVEKWLRDSRERMEMALKGSNAAMWEWNIKTGESFFSERWAGIIGFDLEELQPMSIEKWRSLCHPEDIELSIRHLKRHFAGETEYYQYEMRMKHKNGSWIWVSDHGKVLEWDESGAPLRMFGTTVDITKARREEHYTRARLRLANLLYKSSGIESIMQATIDEAEALTDSRIGFFHFVDDNQNTISLQTWSSSTMTSQCSAHGIGMHYPVTEAGIWADSIRFRESRIYNNFRDLPGPRQFPEGHASVSSFIAIPILRNNLVVAVIGVGNKATAYDEHDLELVKRLAEGSFDIILRKRAEEALRESEEKYRGLMESLNNAVSTVDSEGSFVFLNDMAAENLGGTPGELIGRNIRELFPEPYASQQLSAVQKVFQTDKEFLYETQRMIKRELRWSRVAFQPLHNERGEVSQVLVNVTDIHDLKVAQQELRDLNRTLEEKVAARSAEVQDLYDNAPAGYHSLDADGRFLMVNQTELSWLGYSREQMLGRPALEFLTEESQNIIKEIVPVILRRGWIMDIEIEFVRADGSILPVSLNSTAVRDAAGIFVMSRSTIFDMTERKRAENERLRSMNFIRALLDSIPTPVFYKDKEGRYLGCNRAYTEFTGFTLERISGKFPCGIMATRQSEAFRQEDLDLLQNGGSRFYETTMHSRDGTQRPIIFVKNIFLDEKSKAAGIVGAFIDITERKHAEEALRQANQELERAMRMKDQFLATMSHELRTPLTGILGLSEALQMETYGGLNERQRKTIKNIETGGRHLLALINDVLDLSKIEAGKLSLEVMRCTLDDICQASLQLTKGMAQQRHQRVTYSAPIDPVLVSVDARRIKQVIVNLLSNAIKFTPEGGELGLTVEPCNDIRKVRVIVWDRGIGIKQEHLHRLFQPFMQIDARLSREYTGTGLGLALVKKLLELHEGTVEVESVFGQGSRFIIILPCAERQAYPPLPLPVAADAEKPRTAGVDASSPCIMVVDDNTLLLDMLADFLDATGYRTVRSQSGKDALEKLGEVAPDIILMDIQMPGMDGLETIRRIRAYPDSMIASIPIIAVTALAMPGDRERCLEAGANDYLPKPVKLSELAGILQPLVPGRTAS